jgi:phosphatidylinositol alpha-1,6-mannosyltransferase
MDMDITSAKGLSTHGRDARGEKPRVLLVLTEFPPRIGGMQTHAGYLLKHLLASGYAVSVITYQPASPEEHAATLTFDQQLGVKIHRRLSRLGFWHNIERITELGRRFRPNLVYCSTVFYGYLRDTLDVPVICRSVGNDVLRPWIAYPFRPGSRVLSTPYVDDRLYKFFRRFDYPELIEVLFRDQRHELMRRSARRMDRVIANSSFTASLLEEIGLQREQIDILVGGVEAKRFAPRPGFDRTRLRSALGIPQDAYLMTTACRLVAKKGIDFLLPAMPRIRREIPNAHLLIIGEGRHGRRYQRLATQLGLLDCVTFAGRVDHQRIHEYYWTSDVFVLASRVQLDPTTGLRDAETMGRVLCEANAAALPTVAARSGGIPSVVTHEENGLLFRPDDLDDLLEQLQRVRQDRILRERLVWRGRNIARDRFDWSVILDEHHKTFAEVLSSANGSAKARRRGEQIVGETVALRSTGHAPLPSATENEQQVLYLPQSRPA